jgi:hypothetical protein
MAYFAKASIEFPRMARSVRWLLYAGLIWRFQPFSRRTPGGRGVKYLQLLSTLGFTIQNLKLILLQIQLHLMLL